MFFSFDGLDGAGKSTQLDLFCAWLVEQGREVVRCYDPGCTPLGDTIRKILLEDKATAISRRSEMLLFMAARAQLVEQVIAPALEAGKVVVSDRYLLANVVYQGYAGGLDVAEIWQIGRVATRGIMPELTFVLDLPLTQAASRIRRPLDRMELQGVEFQSRLRDGFLAAASNDPTHIAIIDASRPIDVIAKDIQTLAAPLLV